MGQVFGHVDPNATMPGPNNTTVADPSKGLSGGQMFARKALAGGLGGLGKGLGQMNNTAGSYSPQIQAPPQPQVDPGYFGVRPKNPYFGA